jgi:hypothetical protein
MPPLILIDPSSNHRTLDAHHSTHTLTTLLHNDQLILVEIQGTLEYNVTGKGGDTEPIKLGDISWDNKVGLIHNSTDPGIESVPLYWTS